MKSYDSLDKPPKRFYLNRKKDVSGVSGTGAVAFGILFNSGKCALSWNGEHNSIDLYDSLKDLQDVHGHNGDTDVVYIDE